MSEVAISDISIALSREQIARCENLIRPYVRQRGERSLILV